MTNVARTWPFTGGWVPKPPEDDAKLQRDTVAHTSPPANGAQSFAPTGVTPHAIASAGWLFHEIAASVMK